MAHNWYNGFRDARNLDRPDGRPLYGYRLDSSEFGTLRDALQRLHQRLETWVGVADHEAAMLVLFVSEWFRRTYERGTWSYGDVFTELGAKRQPEYAVIEPLFERGFSFWRRPVRKVGGRSRRLATAICEGGLPLQLVKRDGAALRQYLRAILDDVARADDLNRPTVALRAAQMHVDRLPTSLNHDFVHVLVCDLVLEAWHLQQQLPEARDVDPIAHLDRTDPEWRHRFPVLLDDDTAMALVRQTVLDAQHARLRGAGELGFEVELVRLDDVRFVVQRRLPVGLYAAAPICAALGIPGDPPTRMTLFAHAAGQPPRAVAWATLTAHDNIARYRLEPPGRRELPTFGIDAIRLSGTTVDGRDFGPVLVSGSMLPDLPLAFEMAEGVTPARLIGVGRTRTRRSPIVVVYSTRRFRAEPELPPIGLLESPDTVAASLVGTGTFIGIDDDLRCTIEAGSDDDISDPPLRLGGRLAPWQADSHPTFVGLPQIRSGGRVVRPVPDGELIWKSAGAGRNWKPWGPKCMGDVVVRHVRGSEIQNEVRLCVLPASLVLRTVHGKSPEVGTLVIEGLRPQRVRIAQPVEVVETTETPKGSSFELRVPDPKLAEMLVRLDFGEDRTAMVLAPFPAKGFRFVDERGERLPPGATVSLDRLSGIRAEAFGYEMRDKINVHAVLRTDDLQSNIRRTSRFQLHDGEERSKSLRLRTVRDQVDHLLSLTRALDAHVTLSIEALGLVERSASVLKVAKYDVVVAPERGRGMVTLRNAGIGDAAPITTRVRVEARPLATLAQSVVLRADATPPTEWQFEPTMRAAGPWLITAWEGTRCVARPLLWTVGADEVLTPMPQADSGLVQAMCIARPEARLAAIHLALRELATATDSPDWGVLGSCLETVGVLPTETFDVVTALVDHPETLVGALLRQTTNLRNLWLRLPDLLFVWETVPVSAWQQAVKSFRDQLNASWESTPELGLVMTRDTLLANGFASLSGLLADADGVFDVHKELLHQAIPEGFPRSSELRLEAAKSPIGMSQIRMLLATSWDSACTLHQVESWETIVVNGEEMPPEWLVSALRQRPENAHLWHLLQVPPALGFRRPVAFAPLVAALYAIGDVSPEPVVVECLKRLKAFDPTWFEAAYPNFLACAVAALAISDR